MMTDPEQTSLESSLKSDAQQGDPEAIGLWLTRVLSNGPVPIIVQARYQESQLQVLLETQQALKASPIVEQLTAVVTELGIPLTHVEVYAKQAEEVIPDWYQSVVIPQMDPKPQPEPHLLPEDMAVETVIAVADTAVEVMEPDPIVPSARMSRVAAAQQGDVDALNHVFNYLLKSVGIRVKVHLNRRAGSLQVILMGREVPDETYHVEFVCKTVARLELRFIQQLRISGQQQGSFLPTWSHELNLSATPSFWSSMGRVGAQITQVSTQVSQAAVSGAVAAGGKVAEVGSQTTQIIAQTTIAVGQAVGSAATQATDAVGSAMSWVSENPHLQMVTKSLKVDWLAQLIEQVDVEKAAGAVAQLQARYPQEESGQIAHRIIVNKAVFAAGTGVLTSLVPGIAAALIAVDLAANVALQAEMVYQIAAAYGLNLQEPARKGEVLAIFGFAMGGNEAVKLGTSYATKAGFKFLQVVPVAGSVIGASTNAALLYALGYAACRYYESKVDPLSSAVTIAMSKAAGDKYLATTLKQEQVMDQILMHVILAGRPHQTWAGILPEITAVNLSPESLETLRAQQSAPPSLEDLLAQLDPDFVMPLLARCLKIAEMDNEADPAQQELIESLLARFEYTASDFEQGVFSGS